MELEVNLRIEEEKGKVTEYQESTCVSDVDEEDGWGKG